MTPSELSLLVGGPDSGKSTFLVQLYGRLNAGRGHVTLTDTPASLRPVRDGLARLSQGLAVRHTSAGAEAIQELTLTQDNGLPLRLSIPDYPGEAVEELVDRRRISSHWRTLVAESRHWNLFVRIARVNGLPGLPERQDHSSDALEQPRELPMDIRLVELLPDPLSRASANRTLRCTPAGPDDRVVMLGRDPRPTRKCHADDGAERTNSAARRIRHEQLGRCLPTRRGTLGTGRAHWTRPSRTPASSTKAPKRWAT